MSEFMRFHEYNDHEGESWDWWLQVTGNEAEIAKLASLLDAVEEDDDDPWFDLTPDMETEEIVDKLVLYAQNGYYAAHNKVVGVFTCPEHIGDSLYKGGIRDFFTEKPA